MNNLNSRKIAGAAMGISGLLIGFSATTAAASPDGKAIFDRNCSVCHSVMPPPKLAPPILPVASRYRQAFATKQQGVAHMVSFMKSPSKEKMVADPQALARFGLMPAVQMSETELEAVSGWVWDQGASGVWGAGSGAGMRPKQSAPSPKQ